MGCQILADARADLLDRATGNADIPEDRIADRAVGADREIAGQVGIAIGGDGKHIADADRVVGGPGAAEGNGEDEAEPEKQTQRQAAAGRTDGKQGQHGVTLRL